MYRQIAVHEESAVLTFYIETGEQYFQLGMKVSEALWQKTKDVSYLGKYLEYSEKSKNRLMYRDMLAADEKKSADGRQIKKERALRALIKQEQLKGLRGNDNFDLAVAAYDMLEEEIRAKDKSKLGEVLVKDLIKSSEVLQLVKEKQQCFLSIEGIDDYIYFLVINDKGLTLDRTHFPAALQAATEQILKNLSSNGDTTGLKDLAYRMLPQRIVEQLSSKLYVVPDGIFFRFPFAALLPSGYEVYYTPSLQLLTERKEHDQPQQSKLAVFTFTDPETVKSEKRTKLRELPGTYKEALKLKKSYPNASIFTGRSATKENFIKVYQDPSYTGIHLALHGLANSAERDNVKLYFRTKDYGLDSLYGYELLNYRSNIRSVTLSACQSGLGAFAAGEGSYSLPRYFIINGATEVKASMWDLEDEGVNPYSTITYLR
jgi:CHAT domain-containing protein